MPDEVTRAKEQILRALSQSPSGYMLRSKLTRRFRMSAQTFQNAFDSLKARGEVEEEEVHTKGRPSKMIRLIDFKPLQSYFPADAAETGHVASCGECRHFAPLSSEACDVGLCRCACPAVDPKTGAAIFPRVKSSDTCGAAVKQTDSDEIGEAAVKQSKPDETASNDACADAEMEKNDGNN